MFADADALPWFEGDRPSAQAVAALALLDDAGTQGLDPRDYAASTLRSALHAAAQGPALAPPARERLGRALTVALSQYLKDLHRGRIAPAALGYRFAPDAGAPFDAAAALRRAIADGDLSRAVREAVPALPQYERLREALAGYRALAGDPAWSRSLPRLPPPVGGGPRALEPGAAWVGVPLLAARLAALGDLVEAVAVPPPGAAPVYDDALVEALRAFQQRHGLAVDGIVGRATLAALQVPPAQRARQLELALERLRWTPLRQAPRMIVVNLPEFVLRAYELQGERVVVRAQMKVIVGQALDKRTPLIAEELRFVEFQPYWNVPPSIAREELVPRLRREPAYWVREGFEFVATGAAGPAGGPADPVLSEAGLRATLEGRLRIRQRPGPRNALGDIKFVFPNREAIYLHHTPSPGLFERPRRDFSHGCIRVEDPVALAAFALQGMPGWTEARIRQAMSADPPATVTLARPVPVLIVYVTALAKGGRVYFFDDVYGHDRVLDAALRHRVPPPIPLTGLAAAPPGAAAARSPAP